MSMSNQQEKPWYKKWWGIILTIIFFPFVVPYLVWTKTTWNKWIKIGITVICGIIIISNIVSIQQEKQEDLQQKQEAANLVNQAETYISENNIAEALVALTKSQELDPEMSTNSKAFSLERSLRDLQSDDFLKQALGNMSDSDFELLKNGELETSFIRYKEVNKLFLLKLQENADERAEYKAYAEEKKEQELAEREQERAEAEEEKRKEMLSEQFSTWDGSHIQLTKVIKASMNDPKSYEHVETVYWDRQDHLIVSTTFRGKKRFWWNCQKYG